VIPVHLGGQPDLGRQPVDTRLEALIQRKEHASHRRRSARILAASGLERAGAHRHGVVPSAQPARENPLDLPAAVTQAPDRLRATRSRAASAAALLH